MSTKRPTFLHERALLAKGYTTIAGVDEAGCGAFAGPVVAGAAVLPLNSRIKDLRDSKLATPFMRERLYAQVVDRAHAWAAGEASVEEIDALGMRRATYLAMRRAIGRIAHADALLVDAWRIPGVDIRQEGIVRGDRTVKSIAAASIIAKVTRDRIMKRLDADYPAYGFGVHMGYGTKAHRDALARHGACAAHRRVYVRNWAKTSEKSPIQR